MSDWLDSSPKSRPTAGECPERLPEPGPGHPPCGPPEGPAPLGLAGPSRPEEPPGDLGEPEALREALLARFERPEDVAALRRVGAMLFELVNESGQWGPRRAGVPEVSPTRLSLSAASADLFHTARDLAAVAADRFETELGSEDRLLAEQAERWAASATRLAAVIGSVVEGEGEPGSVS